MTVEVIQVDRDAASAYVGANFGVKYIQGTREGTAWTGLSEAFARHRIAHQGQVLKKEENLDTFMKPYSDAGHDVGSLFAYPAYKCKICGAAQIDLSEDLMYGDIRPCTAHQGCNDTEHLLSTEANAGRLKSALAAMPTPTVKDSLTGDVAELVERLGWHHEHPITGKLILINPDGPEAAAKLTELAAEVGDCLETIAAHQRMYRKLMDKYREAVAEVERLRAIVGDEK